MKLDALLAYVDLSPLPWLPSRQTQLGLYYLAQHALGAGFQVRVDNLSSTDAVAARLTRLLREHECSLLGLYVDHDSQWELRRVVPQVKRALPQLEVILGGPQATAAPEQVLELIPDAACAVIGEGEETFVELLGRRPLVPAALGECPGLAFVREGQVVRTPARARLLDLDRLAIPRRQELSVEGKVDDPNSLMTGRGCVGRCAFCTEGAAPRGARGKVRLRSVEGCLEEFDYLVTTFQPRYVSFLDDTLVSAPERLRKLCRGLIERYHGSVRWFCEARADALFRHPDLLPLMIEAGLVRMQLGGESGCQRILDVYRKGTTLDQLRWVVRRAHELGLVSCYVNFILGGAFETRETYQATRDFACELLELSPGCAGVGHSYFTPYPGTPIHAAPAEYGLEPLDRDAVTGLGDKSVFCRTAALSRFDILELGEDFEERVREKMLALWPQVPDEVAERVLLAHEDLGLESEWYGALERLPELYSYHQSRVVGRCRRLARTETPAPALAAEIPLRTVALSSSAGGRYVVRAPRRQVVQLDEIDGMLMELSAGKLCFAEIVDVVGQRLEPTPPTRLEDLLRARLGALEDEGLLLWRPALES